MKVRDIMTETVVTIPPTMTVGEVAALLRERDLSGVPVIDASGVLVGMVSELDLIARHARIHMLRYLQIMEYQIYLESPDRFEDELERVLGTTAADIMSEKVYTIGPEADLQDLATLMVDHHANPVPVVEGGRLVGIVSYHDLLQVLERPGADQSTS
jgi:CBS domain-containing protein